jgi:hypothetical protein
MRAQCECDARAAGFLLYSQGSPLVYNDLVVSLALIGGLAAAALLAIDTTPAPADSAPARPLFAVVPGGSGSPLAAVPKSGPSRVVWTGFQVTDEGARVFVQTTGQVALEVAGGAGKTVGVATGLTVTLHNCRVHMRNNSRTLDTRFFSGPVQQIAVHQRHRDVQLDIALKQPATPTPREETGSDGTHFWVIDFVPAPAVVTATPEKPASLK